MNDGGPAFPSLEVYEGYDRDRDDYVVKSDVATGMSLRDWFAGQALVMSGPIIAAQVANGAPIEDQSEYIANAVYRMADAMLKAREAK